MNVLCPGCQKSIRVPPERRAVPNLRAKCGACGTTFAVAEATLALAGASQSSDGPDLGALLLGEPAAPSGAPGLEVPMPAAGPVPPGDAPDLTALLAAEPATPAAGAAKGDAARTNAVREATGARAAHTIGPPVSELGAVLSYPFNDGLVYALLSMLVGSVSWTCSMLARDGAFAYLFSQVLLFAYAFAAIQGVSADGLRTSIPRTWTTEAWRSPVRHGLAAFLVSGGPLWLLLLLAPEQGLSPPWLAVLVLAFLWKVVYAPVALVLAAISRSVRETLDPVAGLAAVRRMGSAYREAIPFYAAIAVVETAVSALAGLVPVAGHFVRGLVQTYAYLAIGCLLGLPVSRKAGAPRLD